MENKYVSRLKSLVFFLFLFCQQLLAQQYKGIIDAQLLAERDKYGFSVNDINQYSISSEQTDPKTGLTYTYIQQLSNNIPVFNAISVFLIKENKVVYSKLGMVKNISENVKNVTPIITPEAAIANALLHLKINSNPSVKSLPNNSTGNFMFDLSAVSPSPVRVQLVYLVNEKGTYLAWDVSIEMKNLPNWWNIRIDAMNGRYLEKNDWNVSCSFDSNGNHQHGGAPISNVQKNVSSGSNISPKIAAPTAGQYNVFPYPIEAPTFGSRSLLTDPHDTIASPFGWHDTNGVAGAEHTITRGNNVFAYSDEDANNLPGDSPDGSASLIFDFPFVNAIGNPPVTNKDAATTNLFYANNRIHDVLYHNGFNEIAGNFQQKNYSNQGYGNDAVNAESLDGFGTNNANFRTPPDGFNPRMQMFVWTAAGNCGSLTIASTGFNGSMAFGSPTFTTPIGVFSAEVVLVNDGIPNTADACSALAAGSLTGKIVLIDRGTCQFIDKVNRAAAAGAIGVIIANNVAGSPPGLGGTGSVTIPVISVSQNDGDILKSQLLLGTVTATINTCTATFDGSFENGIIAHEYGHGVSNRLTGGPLNSSCVSNAESGGEGWSDWLALIMTTKASDVPNILTQSKGIGTYVQGQPTNGAGIRRFRYSYDMAINPQTYATVASSSTVHAIGEIWCSAIWDMTSLLIHELGFNADPTNTTAGNNIAMKLVLEGMKLQPCSPGFLDSRDAILQADAILYNNAHRCLIWQAFARRGMGVNADQGYSFDSVDQTAGFNLPSFCTTAPTQSPSAAFNSSSATIQCASSVQFTDQSIEPNTWLWEFGDGTTSNLQNPSHQYTTPGIFNVKLTVTNSLGSNSITNPINVSAPFTANVTTMPNSVVCGSPVQLNALASGSSNISYSVNSIPYAPLTGTFTQVPLSINDFSIELPIGFNFNFYGQDYTSFYIASDGFITFTGIPELGTRRGLPIPFAYAPNNLIALAMNFLVPSSVGYFLTGAAPNQKLVVQFTANHIGTAETPGNPPYPFIVQAILSESTNEIEIHTNTISNVTAYDPTSTTSQGIENENGTQGTEIPGRSYAIFSASMDAFKFTPSVSYKYEWVTNNFMGANQTVNPIASTTYNVKVSDGSGCVQTFTSPQVTVTPLVPTISGNAPFCSGNSIVLDAGVHDSYLWNNFATTQTISVSTEATFIVTVTDANTCSGTASVTTSFKPISECCINNPIVTNSNNTGPGSLRQAVLDACPGSTITFQMAAPLVPSPISLTSSRIIIDKNLTIQGPATGQLTVQNTAAAGPNSYVFHVNTGVVATITDLTISGGNVNLDYVGGGITNQGSLTLSKTKITGNSAITGGGILNFGTLNIDKSTIDGNTSSIVGGGLQNISFALPQATAIIKNSTISANNSGFGAGILNLNANITIENSTIANNISNSVDPTGGGGGLENRASQFATNATLANVTFSGNQQTNSAGPTADDIYSGNYFGLQSTVTLKNTILGGSAATSSPNVRVFTDGSPSAVAALGAITSLGNNLSSDNAGGFFIGTGDIINQNPQLGPLQNNGGDTQTMALLANSPALNAGTCDLTTDQRGTARAANTTCDIGSFEFNNTPLPVTLISLSVKKQENDNLLKWKVAQEIALDGYEVQKSEDGKTFEKIGFVNGIEATDYQFLDKTINANFNNSFAPIISYYRLKMLENDGKFNFSKIVSIENEIEKAIVSNFYPNPPTDKTIFVNITVNQADNWLTNLVGTNGILHKTKTITLKKGINKVPFEISNLPKGVYFVKFINNLKQEVVRKFVVE